MKPGPDRGVDGRKVFFDPAGSTERREIIVSVKGGKLPATCVRDLIGTVSRERAHTGLLISAHEPTAAMKRDAAEVAPYRGSDGRLYPAIQLLTVKQLLAGRMIEYPLQLAYSQPITTTATPGRPSAAALNVRRPKPVKAALDQPIRSAARRKRR